MTYLFRPGKSYEVKTVHGCLDGHCTWYPVMGPEHSDADLGFEPMHYHYDWRFMPEHILRSWNRNQAGRWLNLCGTNGAMLLVMYGAGCRPHIEHRLMKCLREMPIYPAHTGFSQMLNDTFKHCKLTSMTCPHKGMPLNGLPIINDVVTCPGHGLRWNVVTGELCGGEY